jgi:hypothetical protein
MIRQRPLGALSAADRFAKKFNFRVLIFALFQKFNLNFRELVDELNQIKINLNGDDRNGQKSPKMRRKPNGWRRLEKRELIRSSCYAAGNFDADEYHAHGNPAVGSRARNPHTGRSPEKCALVSFACSPFFFIHS